MTAVDELRAAADRIEALCPKTSNWNAGLPVPRTDATWGARDIVAEITRQTDDLARLRGIEQRAREVAEANTSSPTKNPVAIRAARYILGEDTPDADTR